MEEVIGPHLQMMNERTYVANVCIVILTDYKIHYAFITGSVLKLEVPSKELK